MPVKQNVDPDEVNKFSAIGNRWWDLQGDFQTLHDINPLRMDVITKHLNLSDMKMLDVGCGGGILSEALAHQGAKVTGLDANPSTIQAAIKHAQHSDLPIQYHCQTIETHASPPTPRLYDAITCMELLEHVPHPAAIIQSCSRLLKPGGWLFCSTLNRSLKSYFQAIIAAEYVLNLLPRGTHQYEKFIQPATLCSWARTHNLNLVELIGIGYNPLTGAYFPQQSVDVNYIATFQMTGDV